MQLYQLKRCNIMEFKTFETERLILKPTDKNDAAFILQLLNTPKWIAFIGDRNVTTVNDAEMYIENRMMPHLKRLGYGNYTMISKAGGHKVGTCGLYDREGLDGVDIGFALLPEFEKQGYALEGVSKLKDLAFSVFNLTSISGITTKDNTASQNLLLKIGLTFEKKVTLPNDPVELLLFKLSL